MQYILICLLSFIVGCGFGTGSTYQTITPSPTPPPVSGALLIPGATPVVACKYHGTPVIILYCVNNNLYEGQWENGQLADLIPPGNYGTFSQVPCYFTVEPNCVIIDTTRY